MPRFSVSHITKYSYPSDVSDSANQIILYPQSSDQQQVVSERITIKPGANIDTFDDYFGNQVGVFTIVEPHRELIIRADLIVETFALAESENPLSVPEQWMTLEQEKWNFPCVDFLEVEKCACREALEELFQQLLSEGIGIEETVFILSNFIYQNFEYRQGVTTVESTVDEIWDLKAGVCQDFAHLLICMLRLIGIPARYISGYICPSNIELRGEGATHAWVEVFVPGEGWKGIDPTNDCWISDRHIKIAYGRSFKDCTPVKGTYKGPSDHVLHVSVVITNEHTKEKTANAPIDHPITYTSTTVSSDQRNSYQRYLEMQQQQQQQ